MENRKQKIETRKWKLANADQEAKPGVSNLERRISKLETRKWKLASANQKAELGMTSFQLPVSIFQFRFSSFDFRIMAPAR